MEPKKPELTPASSSLLSDDTPLDWDSDDQKWITMGKWTRIRWAAQRERADWPEINVAPKDISSEVSFGL